MKHSAFLINLIVFLAFSFIGTGYAAVSDDLNINGQVSVEPPNYDTIVITDISVVSGNIGSEGHARVIPTSIHTTLTGSAGQTVTYRVSAHNYSETETYIYTGEFYSDDFKATGDKMTISASTDAEGKKPLTDNVSASVVNGTPIAPGEDFVFYATYTLDESVGGEEMLVMYSFEPVIYTITYLNEHEVWAVDYIVNNESPYYVRSDGPERAGQVFHDWVNANAVGIDSYPAGNTNDYTLSAKWENLYLIIFVDENGEVIYQETFTNSSKGLSASGQAIVDAKLAELSAIAAVDEMTVAWSDYNISNATSDITVRPIYTYTGNLKFTPIDEDGDGIIDYYQVDAVAKLKNPTKIPGRFHGLDVRVVNKLYLNENNFDYGAGVTTIEIGEGVKTLNHNALAYTADLSTVKLPGTLEYIGKNTFSRNFGDDKKKLTIEFNGTMAEWQEIVNNSHEDWHNGLQDGSVVKCSDGYFELDRGFLGLGGYKWTSHKY